MKPQNESGDQQLPPGEHQWPAGLEFMSALEKLEELEGEEHLALMRTVLEDVRKFGDRLRQHGLDPDEIAMELQQHVDRMEKLRKDAERAEENYLQAIADKEDGTWRLLDVMEAALKKAVEEHPFHPQVQEWKEQVEELRKQYPKID